jgi:hypothetical protein
VDDCQFGYITKLNKNRCSLVNAHKHVVNSSQNGEANEYDIVCKVSGLPVNWVLLLILLTSQPCVQIGGVPGEFKGLTTLIYARGFNLW